MESLNDAEREALIRHGRDCFGADACLLELVSRKIEGGFAAKGTSCLELSFLDASGSRRSLKALRKQGSLPEVRVMQALSGLADLATVPGLIHAAEGSNPEKGGTAETGAWFIQSWIEGTPLTFDDELPVAVASDLARIHCHFESRLDDCLSLPGMWQVGPGFWAERVGTVFNEEATLRAKGQIACPQALRNEFFVVCRSGIFERILESLPITLLHGDVHPGNILARQNGGHALVDWGNARLGPAMLDIANLAGPGSPAWETYLAIRRELGRPIAPDAALRENTWASGLINLQYLPFALHHLPDKVPMMMESVIFAARELS